MTDRAATLRCENPKRGEFSLTVAGGNALPLTAYQVPQDVRASLVSKGDTIAVWVIMDGPKRVSKMWRADAPRPVEETPSEAPIEDEDEDEEPDEAEPVLASLPPSPVGARFALQPVQMTSDSGFRQTAASVQASFLNPYNFVPSPPRVPGAHAFADRAPKGHHAFHADTFSGRIEIKMEAVTPLLVVDGARALEAEGAPGHKVFPPRIGKDGKPLVPATSVKGMLRSAFEAITHSRFPFLSEVHDKPLGLRMAAGEGLAMVPGIVTNGASAVTLLHGTNANVPKPGDRGRWDSNANTHSLYGAWWKQVGYTAGHGATRPICHGIKPQHGDAVRCYIRRDRHATRPFNYWSVMAIELADGPVTLTEEDAAAAGYRFLPRGYACVTGENIKGKHDERVFFMAAGAARDPGFSWLPRSIPLHGSLEEQWRHLILQTKLLHKKALDRRQEKKIAPDAYLGHKPGQTAFSRHTHTDGVEDLRDGSLVYVRFDNRGQPCGLFPVQISRELYRLPPSALIPPSLRPASQEAEMSPADRVFGWVNQQGHGAWKGSLRVQQVEYRRADSGEKVPFLAFSERLGARKQPNGALVEPSVARDSNGLPLAIMAQPKPEQARFYAAQDQRGTPMCDALPKSSGYGAPAQGLRGRKQYVHHAQIASSADYWRPPATATKPTTQAAGQPVQHAGRTVYREYLRPVVGNTNPDSALRDDQNRSVTGWIKPAVMFHVDVGITNLPLAELGALLWLLDLDKAGHPDAHLRLGGGKALGFGSVRLTIDWERSRIRSGADMRARYLSLTGIGPRQDALALREKAVAAFGDALAASQGRPRDSFLQTDIIKAFLAIATGTPELPVHYPRATGPLVDDKGPIPPDPAGESFHWFVANERNAGDRAGRGSTLPSATAGPAKMALRGYRKG